MFKTPYTENQPKEGIIFEDDSLTDPSLHVPMNVLIKNMINTGKRSLATQQLLYDTERELDGLPPITRIKGTDFQDVLKVNGELQQQYKVYAENKVRLKKQREQKEIISEYERTKTNESISSEDSPETTDTGA